MLKQKVIKKNFYREYSAPFYSYLCTMKYFENDVIACDDGSKTLVHSIIGDTYHSTAGSVAESRHVYIEAGLNSIDKPHITIFEVGFGTGINAILSLVEAATRNISIHYYTIELYPISENCVASLEMDKYLTKEAYDLFTSIHKADWNRDVKITEGFILHKILGDITTCDIPQNINLVYFDAFAPDTQPELWSVDVIQRIYDAMDTYATIVTYSAKGRVKEALRTCGFEVKRLKGALGKRHMVRAIKHSVL